MARIVCTTKPSISVRFLRLTSAQKNLAAGAEAKNLAVRAIRLARITATAAVPDEPVAPICPMLEIGRAHV